MEKEKITLTPIDEENFNIVSKKLNEDPEVNKFVSFYNVSNTDAILVDNKIAGLFKLSRFIEGNMTIHIALLKEYRGKGIGGIAINKIVEEYGENYPDAQYFMGNMNYTNKRAIKSIEKLGWDRTYRYDEMMNDEGGEFFILYEKANPYCPKNKNENERILS